MEIPFFQASKFDIFLFKKYEKEWVFYLVSSISIAENPSLKQCKEVGLTSLSTGWKPGKTHPCAILRKIIRKSLIYALISRENSSKMLHFPVSCAYIV